MDNNNKNYNLASAKSACFRLLKIRLRSEQELRKRLEQKGFSYEIIDDAVQYFIDIDLLNDTKFARSWISSRLAKPFGIKRIIYELKNKGISEDIITEETQKAEDTFCESEVVKTLAKKQALKYKRINKITIKQRVHRYLARRGFSSYSISKAIKKL